MQRITNDIDAMANGYTQAVIAEGGDYVLELLIRPDTDLDSRFRAFDVDNNEMLTVNGWLFSIERN